MRSVPDADAVNTWHDAVPVGTVLNFSAHETIVGEVSIAIAFKQADGAVLTYSVILPIDRIQGWSEKLNHAINAALRHAPRRV